MAVIAPARIIQDYSPELLYQKKDWFDANKDNFVNSFKHTQGVGNNVCKDIEKNILRFGTLQYDNTTNYYTVLFNTGLSLYHASRLLALNHSDFPINTYSNNNSPEKNKELFLTQYYTDKNRNYSLNSQSFHQFFSLPDTIDEYMLHMSQLNNKFMAAYRYQNTPRNSRDTLYEQNNLAQTYKYYIPTRTDPGQYTKDRTSIKPEGVFAYVTTEPIKLLVFAYNDFGRDIFNIGKHNMRQIYGKLPDEFKKYQIGPLTGPKIFGAVTGIGPALDSIKLFQYENNNYNTIDSLLENWKKYGHLFAGCEDKRKGKEEVKGWDNGIAKVCSELEQGTKDLNKIFAERLDGFRVSTFAMDRPVINVIRDVLETQEEERAKQEMQEIQEIQGLISTNIINFIKPFFDQEVILWYSPDIMRRNVTNPYDTDYHSIFPGLLQEYRKYITTNIGFHAGDLLEHSEWTALESLDVYNRIIVNDIKYGEENNDDVKQYKPEFICNRNPNECDTVIKDLIINTSLLHDVAKAGKCGQKTLEFKDLNITKGLVINECKIDHNMDPTNYNNYKYYEFYDIPFHPELGYRILKGYDEFNFYGLYNNEVSYTWFYQILEMLKKKYPINFNTYFKIIKIAIACHWKFGDYLLRIYENNYESHTPYFNTMIHKYLNEIEMYFNAEFYDINDVDNGVGLFTNIVKFVVLISIGDILGSRYDKTLEEEDEYRVYNHYPTHYPDYWLPSEIEADREKTGGNLWLSGLDKDKKTMVTRSFNCLDRILKTINACSKTKYKYPNIDGLNSYSLLYTLTDGITDIQSLYRMFPIDKFIPLIAFDLDGTLIKYTIVNNMPVYEFLPGIEDMLISLQSISENFPIIVMSRHYIPNYLYRWLTTTNKKTGHGKIIDYFYCIVSIYTGDNTDTEYMDFKYKHKTLNVDGQTDFVYVRNKHRIKVKRKNNKYTGRCLGKEITGGKCDHVAFIKDVLTSYYPENVYKDTIYRIVLFDDDDKYATKKGIDDDVYVVKVLPYIGFDIRTVIKSLGIIYFNYINDNSIRSSIVPPK